MTTTDMTPQEYADLVRDAHTLIDGIELVTRRGAAVFVLASVVTVAAMLTGLDPIGTVTATVAVLAFVVALIATAARITLGEAPDEAYDGATGVAGVVDQAATGSAAATPENGGIPPK